jgi:hypothetical protein
MPPVVAVIAGWLVAAGVTVATATFVATYVVSVLVTFALGKLAGLFGESPTSSGLSSGNSPQTYTVHSTTAAAQILYGQLKTSGVIIFEGVSASGGGSTNDWLWMVLALSHHQVDGITDIYLDSDCIPDYTIDGTGLVTTGKFANKLHVYRLLGTDAQTVQTNLDAAFPEITSSHRGRGVAYIVLRFDRDAKVFPNGAPQNIFAMVRGKRLYDPRLDSTNGGAGAQRLADATTWTWSQNPALAAADYITGGSMVFDVATPNNRLGMRAPTAYVNWTLVAAAANKADEIVSISGIASGTMSIQTSGAGAGTFVSDVMTKTAGGAATWDTSVRNTVGMVSGRITAKHSGGSVTRWMIALNSDPATDASYTGLDFAWYSDTPNSDWAIYENGALVNATAVPIALTDICEIEYDGTWVRYLLNGKLWRTVAVPTVGMTLFFDSSLANVGAAFQVNVQRRYVCNGSLNCGDTHEANLDKIVASMAGNRVFTGGAYRIFAGSYDTPSETITDDDLGKEGYKVQGALSGSDVYNQTAAVYFDPMRGWQQNTSYVRTDATFITADGRTILKNLPLAMVTNEHQAQRIAEIWKQKSRNQVTAELTLKLAGLRLAPWDTFFWTCTDLGYSNKVMRVNVVEVDLAGRSVKVSCQEEYASVYADLAAAGYGAPTSAMPVQQLEGPDAPTGLTTTAFQAYIAFNVTLPAHFTPGSTVELWEYTAATPFSSASKVAETTGDVMVLSKNDNVTRYYWVRIRNRNIQYSPTFPAATGQAAKAGGETGNNLLDMSQWKVGTTGTQGNFTALAGTTGGDNAIVLASTSSSPYGPNGNSEPLWYTVGSTASGPDGGWDTDALGIVGIDDKKSYRSSVWFYWNGVGVVGGFYHGCSPTTTNDLAGAAAGNPYFTHSNMSGVFAANKWYLSVGIIHGSGFGTVSSGQSGVYDPATGAIVLAGTDYKQIAGSTTQVHRTYQYYSATTGSIVYFARPRFEEINADTPSILGLLGPAGTGMVNSGAATDIFQVFTAGGFSTVNGTGAYRYLYGLTVGSAPAFDCTVICTVVYTQIWTAGTLGNSTVVLGFADDGTNYTYSTAENAMTNTAQTQVIQWQYSHVKANSPPTSPTMKLYEHHTAGPNTDGATYTQLTAQMEFIKR